LQTEIQHDLSCNECLKDAAHFTYWAATNGHIDVVEKLLPHCARAVATQATQAGATEAEAATLCGSMAELCSPTLNWVSVCMYLFNVQSLSFSCYMVLHPSMVSMSLHRVFHPRCCLQAAGAQPEQCRVLSALIEAGADVNAYNSHWFVVSRQ